jgi:prefoldin subunit 5
MFKEIMTLFGPQPVKTVDSVIKVLDEMLPELDDLHVTHQNNINNIAEEIKQLQSDAIKHAKERDRALTIKTNLKNLLGK